MNVCVCVCVFVAVCLCVRACVCFPEGVEEDYSIGIKAAVASLEVCVCMCILCVYMHFKHGAPSDCSLLIRSCPFPSQRPIRPAHDFLLKTQTQAALMRIKRQAGLSLKMVRALTNMCVLVQ